MPSSPNGPCRTGNATSTPGRPRPGSTATVSPCSRQTPSRPISILRTSCPRALQAFRHGGGRRQRDIMLGGATAAEDGYAESAHFDVVVLVVEVGEDVVVVVVVVEVGGL